MRIGGTVHGRYYRCNKCEGEWIVLSYPSKQCPTCGSADIGETKEVYYRCKKCENEWVGKTEECPSCKLKEIEEKEVHDSRIRIGEVGVDSGQLVICDPCYIKHDGKQKDLNDYSQLLSIREEKTTNRFDYKDRRWSQLKFDKGHDGLGVVFDSGCGDGTYEVFATVGDMPGWGRRVKKVEVILVENPDDHIDYEFDDEQDEDYIKFDEKRNKEWEAERKEREEEKKRKTEE